MHENKILKQIKMHLRAKFCPYLFCNLHAKKYEQKKIIQLQSSTNW